MTFVKLAIVSLETKLRNTIIDFETRVSLEMSWPLLVISLRTWKHQYQSGNIATDFETLLLSWKSAIYLETFALIFLLPTLKTTVSNQKLCFQIDRYVSKLAITVSTYSSNLDHSFYLNPNTTEMSKVNRNLK